MTLFIGLDGGGTGCRAQAAHADGRLGAPLEGGSANIHTDPAGAEHRIADLLARVLKAEGWQDANSPHLHVVLGLAGASESGAATRLAAALPFRNLAVLGDIDISLSGAFESADGIVMAVGTGSVLARQSKGQMQRVGGYGFVLGDEASGAWMGRRALALALHARDGLVPDAPLAKHIWERFKTLPELLAFTAIARPADYAGIAPQIIALDQTGCALSRTILDDGCSYLLRAIRHLQADDTSMPVAAVGGLGPCLLDRISAIANPPLHAIKPKGTALDGALWRARQFAYSKGLTE